VAGLRRLFGRGVKREAWIGVWNDTEGVKMSRKKSAAPPPDGKPAAKSRSGKKSAAAVLPPAGTPKAEDPGAQGWAGIWRRLETVRSALNTGFDPSPEQERVILEERAVELAREGKQQAVAVAQITLVEFLLAHERYGIEPDFVREIVPLKTLTPVPFTPGFVLGVTNLRGEILSVIDLKRFFELPDQGLTDSSKLIVLQSKTMTLGILADSVVGTRSIPADQIQPPLPTHTEIRAKYLKGVTEGRLAILDAEQILADERLIVQETL